MIRHREAIPGQTDSRPDLYLAGMQCTQVRPPTPEEERLLKWFGYGGGTLGTIAGLFLIEFVRSSPLISNLIGGWFQILAVMFSAVVLVFAGFIAGPALTSLRRRRVYVFSGPVLRLGAFDSNQRRLFTNRTYPDEMVVLANRRTVLRCGSRFLPIMGRLSGPCAVAADRGPDTRKLTDAEKLELKDLIRRFRRLDPAAWFPLILTALIGVVILPRGFTFAQVATLILVILAVISLFVVPRWQSWWAFSGQLKRDLEDGVITGGNLWSGMPWLVNGEPAAWRTVQPEAGVGSLNVDALKAL